jgi:hypothetical protein
MVPKVVIEVCPTYEEEISTTTAPVVGVAVMRLEVPVVEKTNPGNAPIPTSLIVRFPDPSLLKHTSWVAASKQIESNPKSLAGRVGTSCAHTAVPKRIINNERMASFFFIIT